MRGRKRGIEGEKGGGKIGECVERKRRKGTTYIAIKGEFTSSTVTLS